MWGTLDRNWATAAPKLSPYVHCSGTGTDPCNCAPWCQPNFLVPDVFKTAPEFSISLNFDWGTYYNSLKSLWGELSGSCDGALVAGVLV